MFWYDNDASIEAKAALASSNNLGGAGVYAVGYENQSFWTAFGNGLAGTFSSVSDYTITASAGSGGTISPSGGVSVPSGASQTFTIRASSGYAISTVTVDGLNKGAIGSYTFADVTAPHTITAAFQRSRRGRR